MRLTVTVRSTDRAGRSVERDVRLTVPPGTALRAVRSELAAAVGTDDDSPVWIGGRAADDSAILGQPGLRPGCIVEFGVARACRERAGVRKLHLVGGPDAGRVVNLGRGSTMVGRARDCTIVLHDREVSRRHAALEVRSGDVLIRDLGSTNGTRVNGAAVGTEPVPLSPGDVIEIGESVLALPADYPRPAAVTVRSDGLRTINRAPRLSRAVEPPVVDLPEPIPDSRAPAPQWLAASLPAVAGGAFAWLAHNVAFLAFALLSPVMVLGQAAGDRVQLRRQHRRQVRQHALLERRAHARATALLAEEARRRRRDFPDPAALEQVAELPGDRLWARSCPPREDLSARIGLATQPSNVVLRQAADARPAGLLPAVPVLVDLASGPLGLAGPLEAVTAIARWVICQLAISHPPNELRLVSLLEEPIASGPRPAACAERPWRFLRWLPHTVWPAPCTGGPESWNPSGLADEVVAQSTLATSGGQCRPWTVLLLDDRAAALPEVARLLESGASARVTALAIGSSTAHLPSSCRIVAEFDGEIRTRLHLSASQPATDQPGDYSGVLADQVGVQWADRVARAITGLVDATASVDTAMPREVRLLDLLNLTDPAPDELIARWTARTAPATILGLSSRGPESIDLAADGPHVLIAGTTGAGKSELLQSLIAGLAAAQSPNALNFILVDYKGGAAFADCAGLPHTVAVATDLDGHLTQRALQSLEAELRRRESLLAKAGVPTIDALANRDDGPALARLVIVVDEFAALAHELPEFIRGLVSIAQRGRSLGLHLVLATQRPGGAVSPEIRANTALRIALRVTDPGESADVVGSDLASRISKSTPGRAIFRIGSDLLEAQTARISGRAPVTAQELTVEVLDDRGRTPPPAEEPVGKTDLQLLVAAAREAAARLGCPPPVSPWLPVLAATVPIRGDSQTGRLCLGVIDVPAEQRRERLYTDIRDGTPLLIIGGPGAGKTTTLRALAALSASLHTPDDLHVHVLDFGGGGLQSLAALPHCGSLLSGSDMSCVAGLLEHLSGELAGPPAALLLIDGWDAFLEASEEHDHGRSVERVYGLVRDARPGAAAVVVAGGRSALTGRLPRLIERRILLRLADAGDYAVAGISPKLVPHAIGPGRGLLWGSGLEVQLGVLGDQAGEAAQRQAVAQIADRSPAPRHRPPALFRPLPRRISLAQIPRDRGQPDQLLVGLGGAAATPVTIDLNRPGGRILIAGPPRSGRSTALISMLRQLAGHRRCAVVAPSRSPLAVTAREHGIPAYRPDATGELDIPPDTVLLVDDGEMLRDAALGDVITERLRDGRSTPPVVLAARTDDVAVSYRGPVFELRRTGRVILLRPGPGDGDLIGSPIRARYSAAPPGRGLATLGDLVVGPPTEDVLEVQLALP